MSPHDLAMYVGLCGGCVALTDARRRRVARMFREALDASQPTMLRAAQDAEIDQAQFTRQIDLEAGTLRRLAMQPDAFWQWLAVAIMDEFGMPAKAKRAARLALATFGLKRMARMSAPALPQKEQVG